MAIDFGSSLSSIAKLPTKLNWEDHITPSMNTLDARWIYFQFHREHIKQDIPNCFFVSHSMNLQPDKVLSTGYISFKTSDLGYIHYNYQIDLVK